MKKFLLILALFVICLYCWAENSTQEEINFWFGGVRYIQSVDPKLVLSDSTQKSIQFFQDYTKGFVDATNSYYSIEVPSYIQWDYICQTVACYAFLKGSPGPIADIIRASAGPLLGWPNEK